MGELKYEARIKYIEANMLFMTQEEMAEHLKVSRMTISRDMVRWTNEGGLRRLLVAEFLYHYGKAKRETKNPLKLLDRIITILIKSGLPKPLEEAIQRDIAVTFNLPEKYNITPNGTITLKPLPQPKTPKYPADTRTHDQKEKNEEKRNSADSEDSEEVTVVKKEDV
jgi:hypothetical protein